MFKPHHIGSLMLRQHHIFVVLCSDHIILVVLCSDHIMLVVLCSDHIIFVVLCSDHIILVVLCSDHIRFRSNCSTINWDGTTISWSESAQVSFSARNNLSLRNKLILRRITYRQQGSEVAPASHVPDVREITSDASLYTYGIRDFITKHFWGATRNSFCYRWIWGDNLQNWMNSWAAMMEERQNTNICMSTRPQTWTYSWTKLMNLPITSEDKNLCHAFVSKKHQKQNNWL